MTKKQQQMLWNVTHSIDTNLCDVYKTVSQGKINAFKACMLDCARVSGFNFRITSANMYSFSCGFLYYDEDKHLHCRYYTSQNTYDFIAE